MTLVNDYDVTIEYHPRKVNIVTDALCIKFVSMRSLAFLEVKRHTLAREI